MAWPNILSGTLLQQCRVLSYSNTNMFLTPAPRTIHRRICSYVSSNETQLPTFYVEVYTKYTDSIRRICPHVLPFYLTWNPTQKILIPFLSDTQCSLNNVDSSFALVQIMLPSSYLVWVLRTFSSFCVLSLPPHSNSCSLFLSLFWLFPPDFEKKRRDFGPMIVWISQN